VGAERERAAGSGRLQDGLRLAGGRPRRGPYVSERQRGRCRRTTARMARARDYPPHDHARPRAGRRGQDGPAGFCDIEQRPCPGLALRNNGRDPIPQEHASGRTGAQGNHGDHVKDHRCRAR